jgi:hypothetical protein
VAELYAARLAARAAATSSAGAEQILSEAERIAA